MPAKYTPIRVGLDGVAAFEGCVQANDGIGHERLKATEAYLS